MSQPTFNRETWAEINLDNINYNINNIREFLPEDKEIIAVVKANGYGHGAYAVAKEALNAGAKSLAVAFLDEALSLRQKKITAPILVLGASSPKDIDLAVSNNITLTVFSANWLLEAKKHKKTSLPLLTHLKFDTGMTRLGLRTKKEFEQLVHILDSKMFLLEGVYTHFATADELNNDYYNKQYNQFLKMLKWLKEYNINPSKIHCANSAATLRYKHQTFNAVRIGIIMYGLTPSLEMEHLIPINIKPAFSLHTKIVHIKKISKGECVSYGATYKSQKEEWIATIPIGYADGWTRKTQGFSILVKGKKAPIVGRVCMDQCMIRLEEELQIGEEVILIGSQQDKKITIQEVANYLDTISYEIPCIISSRVPRVYKKNGSYTNIYK